MSKNFKVSVIVPIYNVEPYLEEALDSVIHQTMNFKKYIQLILVNDGSKDASEEICLRYQKKYPQNIVYKYKENGGVSSARNMALDMAEGKYITFFDPDDKLDPKTFKSAYDYIEKHSDEIDVVTFRTRFFEARNNFHTLDFKFWKGTRIADLTTKEEEHSVQSLSTNNLIKRSAIGDLRFDPKLKYGEDSIFINKILLKKLKVGIITEGCYYYRKRFAADSAINSQTSDISFYTDTLTNYHMELIRYSKELYGEVIRYVQAMISYDMYWRFTTNLYNEILTEEQLAQFKENVKTILSYIDDDILLRDPVHKSIARRTAAIRFKYGIDLEKNLQFNPKNNAICYNDIVLFRPQKTVSKCCLVGKAEIENDHFIVDMFVVRWLLHCENGGVRFALQFGDEKVYPEKLTDYHAVMSKNSYAEDEPYYYHYHYEYPVDKLKAKEQINLLPVLEFENGESRINMSYGKFVTNKVLFPEAYQFYGRYLVRCYRDHIMISCPAVAENTKAVLEKRCIKYLKEHNLKDVAKIRKNFRKFEKKEAPKGKIWIFADRIDNAGDNGEAIFKYTCEHKPEGVRPIFMIGKDAKKSVIDRLKSEGEVVFAEDKKYPYYFLMAEKIISSSAGEFTINPFGGKRRYLNDMFKFRYYFTNHGVNCGDCSKWLNKFNKKIDIFFITGKKEKQRIIDDGYLYTEDQLITTGLPRYDLLYEDTKKQILILPTWRRAIKESYDINTSSVYFDGFVNTDYFKFYNGLINDERLLNAMREKGYKGLFCLHPIHMKQSVDFQANDVFSVNDGFVDYNKVFAESSVLVTDYSTIAFDFAHLCKPIVYSQFDKEEFYENQVYDQSFDYETEGFGPICSDKDSVVDELIALMENDCENKYMDRVNGFFAYLDNNNCKRAYDVIVNDKK